MDGGRKPKRRIIDSTSVPTSRRTNSKQSDVTDNSKQNSEQAKTPDAIAIPPLQHAGIVDSVKLETEDIRLSDVIQISKAHIGGVHNTAQDTNRQYEVHTSKNNQPERVKVEEQHTKNILDIKSTDEIQKTKSNQPKSFGNTEQTIDGKRILNAKQRPSSNQTRTLDNTEENIQNTVDSKSVEDIQKSALVQSGTSDTVDRHSANVSPLNEIKTPAFGQTLTSDIMEQSTENSRHSATTPRANKNETEVIHNRGGQLYDTEKIVSSSRTTIDQNQTACKHDDTARAINSKSKAEDVNNDVRFSSSISELNTLGEHSSDIALLTASKYDTFHRDKVKINPLLSIPEDPEQDELQSLVFSDMFETENISVGEASENLISSESVYTKEKHRSVKIKFHEFFGDNDVLSSIGNDSTVDSVDMFDGNIKCQHGLSLFNDPKAVRGSKCVKFSVHESNEKSEIQEGNEIKVNGLETKDPYSIELELTTPLEYNDRPTVSMADLYDVIVHGVGDGADDSPFQDDEAIDEDVYSNIMEGSNGTPRLLSVEERWQIIFNEKTRAPIYAVTQYTGYLNQFVNGHNAASRDSNDVIRKDGINPVSYLLRKLKLDLKMSYESFVEEFIKPKNNGIGLLIKLLKSIQNTGSHQSGSTNMTQLKNYKKTLTDEHDCLLCIKYSLRLKNSLKAVFDINYGLETISMAVIGTYTKSRGTAIEILTLCLSAEDGFSRILDCFTYIQLKIGEPVRFKSLVNMMNMDSQHNTIFKVSTMKFLNTLLDASSNTNIRVFLQHELESAGLDTDYMLQKASGTGLEFDDLRRELLEWKRKYINVDTILSERGTIASRTQEPVNQQMIEELQAQVKKLSADKAYLEYQLNAVSTELRNRYEELQRRTPLQQHAYTQCDLGTSPKKSVSCQCDLAPDNDAFNDRLKHAADYFEWNDVYINDEQGVYCQHEYTDRPKEQDRDQEEMTTSDDEGVVKVQQWLRSHCGSSDSENKLQSRTDDPSSSECPTFYFKRNSLTRQKVRKTEFPGNWKLIPKSIEHFPSRFPPQQCHQTNCDRCDPRYRPENSDLKVSTPVKHFALEVRLNDLVKHKNRSEVRSQSSDSAIGGSGEERTWVEKRIPLVPAVTAEAEILQDLIQPDDSASGCPTSEPYPDYSTINSRFDTQKSFRTELSQVLREFEGNLLQYESPTKSKVNGEENFISLGDI